METGWSIEYVSSLEDEVLYYLAHKIKKKQIDLFDSLGYMLGTHWNKDRIKALLGDGKSSTRPENFLIPLAVLIRPELKEMLKPGITVGGEKLDLAPDEEVVNLMDLPKEEFKRLMNQGR